MTKKTTTKTAKTTTHKPAPKAEPKAQAKKAAKPEPKLPVAKPEHAAPEPEAKATASEPTRETKAAPRARDPRLPAPGTVLQKKDRQGAVRCECTVEDEGIRFKGTLYRSLSAAAMAASKDLGLGGQAQNGFLVWGLVRQAPREKDPVAALEHAWERYRACAEGVLKTGVTDENRAKVLSAVKKHVDALEALRETAA
jgi:hypothetical protein